MLEVSFRLMGFARKIVFFLSVALQSSAFECSTRSSLAPNSDLLQARWWLEFAKYAFEFIDLFSVYSLIRARTPVKVRKRIFGISAFQRRCVVCWAIQVLTLDKQMLLSFSKIFRETLLFRVLFDRQCKLDQNVVSAMQFEEFIDLATATCNAFFH